ncbi:MAG TPA: RHS repeat-associated core domain-containing protein, partial [Mycobacterium sp.]|nr:RHS repeat-associated core domain-containing protein [Mycobacterium sp.]
MPCDRRTARSRHAYGIRKRYRDCRHRPCPSGPPPLVSVHRYYDPSTAQFLSQDPLVAQTGEPYAFAGDNPDNAADPFGLRWYYVNDKWHWYTGHKYDYMCRGNESHCGGPGQHFKKPATHRDCGWFGWKCALHAVSHVVHAAAHFVRQHKKAFEVGAGIVLGVAAAATGVGAIVEAAAGSAALGATLGAASSVAGAAAAALDNGACTHGDAAACFGRDFGFVGVGLGLLATGSAGAASLGLISSEGTSA